MAAHDATPTTAGFESASWSPNAPGWAAHWGRFAAPTREAVVDVPYEAADRAALEDALRVAAALGGASAERAGPVVEAIVGDVAPRYRRADGSYRFENRFRYLIAAN
jgi:hypothetical protein